MRFKTVGGTWIEEGLRTGDGDIDDISTGSRSGQHTSSGDTGSVMRVDVNGEVGVFLANSTNKTTQGLLSVTE